MKYEKRKVSDFVFNKWNPNVMSEQKFQSLKTRIERRDKELVRQPVLARKRGKKLEVIDGEHRLKATKELGTKEVWTILVESTEDEAKLETLGMNEVRGEPDVVKLALVIADLSKRHPVEELSSEIGMTDEQVQDYIDMGLEDIKLSDVDKDLESSEQFKRSVDRVEVFSVELTSEEKERVRKLIKKFDGDSPSDRFMGLIAFSEDAYDKRS